MKELSEIAKLVIDHTGVDIRKKKRDHTTVTHRWLYFKLAFANTNYSLNKIGAAVGRDHATVIHGLKQFDIEVRWDKQLQAKYDELAIIYMKLVKCNTLEKIDMRISFMHKELAKLEVIRNEVLLNESVNTK